MPTFYDVHGEYEIGSLITEARGVGFDSFYPFIKYIITVKTVPGAYEVISVRKLDEDEINRLTKEYKNNQ